ncbi:aldo/keto reductase, partial [Escherichia coli]
MAHPPDNKLQHVNVTPQQGLGVCQASIVYLFTDFEIALEVGYSSIDTDAAFKIELCVVKCLKYSS